MFVTFRQLVSVIGSFVVAGALVACSDASEENGATGSSAGVAGGSNVVPPGSGGSAGASTGGSAGAAGNSTVVPEGGAAGSAGTVDAGTVCAGATCVYGSSPTCTQNGSVYECTCLGIYLPQGVNVGCDSDAGAGGSDGNSNPVLPDAGTSGSGGSSDAGGSGGSSGAGGSGGTTSTGGSGGSSGTSGSGGSSDAGGSGGSSTGVGDLVVTIVAPTSNPANHAYTVHAQTLSFKPGEPDWNSPKTVTGAAGAVVSFTGYAGSVYKLGGYYDPEAGQDPWKHQFCDPVSLKLTVAVWATLDGKALPAPIVKSNGQSGCDLWLTATQLTAATDDADGDGFLAHASDSALVDCDDHDASVNQGMVETPDTFDSVDRNCDTKSGPALVGYRLLVSSQSTTPVLTDWSHGGTTYPMTWNSNGYYTVLVEKPIAPRDFIVQYGSQWNVGWDYNNPGSCITFATVQVYNDISNTIIASGPVAVPQYTTCHTVVTGL